MTTLRVVDSGTIFRNPLPGHRVTNAFFPTLLNVGGDEWLCAMRIAAALYSPGGRLEIFRSQDSGSTWQHQGPVRTNDQDAVAYNYNYGELSALRDGSIVLRIMRVDHSNEDQLIYNPHTQGLMPLEACYVTSNDQGRTWSEPIVPDIRSRFDRRCEPAAFGPVIELDDGRWFQLFETWKTYDDAGPFELNTYGLFSADGGKTWDDRVDVAVGTPSGISYSHAQPVRLANGKLFLSSWTAESQLQNQFDLHAVVSTDATAHSWDQPRCLGIPGQSSCPADLGDNRLLIIYSHRENTDQPGIKVVVSRDGGATFDSSNPLTVWDAYGKESLGVARTDTYPSSHDSIAYGAPKIYKVNGETALASFWCSQGADTYGRWCRIAVE
jgi:hypothetical protein